MDRSIDTIFNDALELGSEERAAFLEAACAGDDELRSEVEQLLFAYESSSELDLPTSALTGELPDKVGPYDIVGELGRGSMGIVYRAKDQTLGRELALKVLPANLAILEDWVGRFEAEARALASLNHPSIATIYSFEEADGQRFITMELVEGPTLAQRLADSPPSRIEALRLCEEIAGALQVAHEKGIVHRDLKPLNIKIDAAGRAKLLDFGIAKSVADLGFAADSGAGSTLTAGTLLPAASTRLSSLPVGTPGYMSPEQEAGREVDHRADIWAFGRILEETFRAAGLPKPIRSLADRCLVADPGMRLSSMRQAHEVLKSQAETPTPGIYWALGFVALSVIAAFVFLQMRTAGDPRDEVARVRDSKRVQVTFSGVAEQAEITPDGRHIAYVDQELPTRNRIRVRGPGSAEPRVVFETWSRPFLRWSPDGRHLLISAHVEGKQDHKTFLVDPFTPNGDAVVREFDTAGPLAWAPDGSRFLTTPSYGKWDSLCVVDVESGAVLRRMGTPEQRPLFDFDWSPDGDRIAFETRQGEDSVIWTMRADGSGSTPFTTGRAASPRWSHDGRYLYHVRGTELRLYATEFDPGSGTAKGEPTLLEPGPIAGSVSVSREGHFVYARGPGQSNVHLLDLAKDPPSDNPLTSGTFSHGITRFSPDGKWIAYTRNSQGRDVELIIHSLTSGERKVVISADGIGMPAWSPDGRQLLFHVIDDGARYYGRYDLEQGRIDEGPGISVGRIVTWHPSNRIFVQNEDGTNFWVVDPETFDKRLLFKDDSSRLVWQIESSPVRDLVAVLETQSKSRGPRVVLVDVGTGRVQPLYNGLAAPIAWSEDGGFVYLITLGDADERARIIRVSVDGATVEEVVRLPNRGGMWSAVDMTTDKRLLSYDYREFHSDIWMIEPGITSIPE